MDDVTIKNALNGSLRSIIQEGLNGISRNREMLAKQLGVSIDGLSYIENHPEKVPCSLLYRLLSHFDQRTANKFCYALLHFRKWS